LKNHLWTERHGAEPRETQKRQENRRGQGHDVLLAGGVAIDLSRAPAVAQARSWPPKLCFIKPGRRKKINVCLCLILLNKSMK
jgi:hypothetical protein